MNLTFKIPLHKEWTLLEDKIIIGDKEILLEEIVGVKLVSKGGMGVNGIFHLRTKDKKVVTLAYPPRVKDAGFRAFTYIQEKSVGFIPEYKERTKMVKKQKSVLKIEKVETEETANKIKKSKVENTYRPRPRTTSKPISKVDNVVSCPKCKGTQISANKKGFGLGKAVAGTVLLNPLIGIGAGMVGKNKIYLSCMHCGHQWKPKR